MGVPDQYDTPEFRALRDEWYSKARESGLDDIEMIDPRTGHPGTNLLKGLSPGDLYRGLYRPDKEDYYRWARQWVWEMEPGPARHVWRLHAEGMASTDIAKALGRRYGLSLYAVKKIVERTADAMRRAAHSSLDEEPDPGTVASLMAAETRPAWFTEPARGGVRGNKFSRRVRGRNDREW